MNYMIRSRLLELDVVDVHDGTVHHVALLQARLERGERERRERGRESRRGCPPRGPSACGRKRKQQRRDREGGGGEGACRCPGNVGNVSEKIQTFRSKERARIGSVLILLAKKERVWAGGIWTKNAFCGQM